MPNWHDHLCNVLNCYFVVLTFWICLGSFFLFSFFEGGMSREINLTIKFTPPVLILDWNFNMHSWLGGGESHLQGCVSQLHQPGLHQPVAVLTCEDKSNSKSCHHTTGLLHWALNGAAIGNHLETTTGTKCGSLGAVHVNHQEHITLWWLPIGF